MKSSAPSTRSTSLSSPWKASKQLHSNLATNSSLGGTNYFLLRNFYRNQSHRLELRSQNVPLARRVAAVLRCAGDVGDEVRLEVEAGSVLVGVVGEAMEAFQEVEVEVLRHGEEAEVPLEEVDLGEDEAEFEVLLRKGHTWRLVARVKCHRFREMLSVGKQGPAWPAIDMRLPMLFGYSKNA
jgi:hypothetical protein